MSIPEFSERGRGNRDIFYSSYNDITIFVEDETLEHFYTTLFSKLLGDHFKIKRVFPLGGKGPSISHYKKFRQGEINIKNPLFLLDRDLDPFLDIEMVEDDVVIYLKDYCIENYLINEEAFYYSLSWQLKLLSEELIEKGYYRAWESETIDKFYNLFISFLICRKYDLGKNADQSPYNFLKNNSFIPDIEKINVYIKQLANRYMEKFTKTEEEFYEELSKLGERTLMLTHNNKQTIISGKYLFISLYKFLQHLCAINKKSTRLDENWFLALLTDKIDLDRISFIKNRAIEVYK